MAGRESMVSWVCAEQVSYSAAKQLHCEEYASSSANSGNSSSYCRGRIESSTVIISQLPPKSPHTGVGSQWAECLSQSLCEIEAILVTGFVDGVGNQDVSEGDLIIYSTGTNHHGFAKSSTSNTMHKAVNLIQKEAGSDGHWLIIDSLREKSGNVNNAGSVRSLDPRTCGQPRLHYVTDATAKVNGNLFQHQVEELRNAIVAGITTGNTKFPSPLVLILGVTKRLHLDDGEHWRRHVASLTALFVKELMTIRSDVLLRSDKSRQSTETVLEAPTCPQIPPFEPCQYTSYGNALLVVIPTNNQHKIRLCRKYINDRIPDDVVIHTIIVPVESDVGEQPYNEAGVLGAHNRIRNAMQRIASTEHQHHLESKGIGTIIFIAIESFIQFDGVVRPVDYGVVVAHNATSQKTASCLSCGVTAPPKFVKRARRFGYMGNMNYGRVTVGQILAAHVPGLDKADWHKLLADRSRYDILEDAVNELPLPR